MIDVTPEPPTAHESVRPCSRRFPPQIDLRQQPGEVYAGVHCQLQRPPKATVDLHKYRLSGALVHFILDHGHTRPAECIEQIDRPLVKRLVHWLALSQHTYATRGRHFTNSAVSKPRDRLTLVAQYEYPYPRAADRFLYEKRKRLSGVFQHPFFQLIDIVDPRNAHLPPCAVWRCIYRACWLQDYRRL